MTEAGRVRVEVDVLVVELATTWGHRHSEAQLVAACREAGLRVARAGTDYRLARYLRFAYPLIDLAEAAALRHAVTRALRKVDPKLIVYPMTGAALLEPGRRLQRGAVRFDALTVDNRPGMRNAVVHVLERRMLRNIRLKLPLSELAEPPGRRPRPDHATTVIFPPYIERQALAGAERSPEVLCYAGDPVKKGLDLAVAGWREAGPPDGVELVITGISGERGRRFLAARGVPEAPQVQWAGGLSPPEHRARMGAATAVLACSRYEEFGMLQLEALADGTPLVTVASVGPYPGLRIVRGLDSRLVVDPPTPVNIATALSHALELTESERRAYAEAAAAHMAAYSRAAFNHRLRQHLVPLATG